MPANLERRYSYGTIDVGGGYQMKGVPFNGVYPNGVEELISKNSNGPRYVLIPNGLGQSNVGVKGNEPIAGDWSLVFNLQTGFDPYTLSRANGPKTLVQNNANPPDPGAAVADGLDGRKRCAISQPGHPRRNSV